MDKQSPQNEDRQKESTSEYSNKTIMEPIQEKVSPWKDLTACFHTISAIFEKNALNKRKGDAWEIPFDAISDLKFIGCGAQGIVCSGKFRGEIVAVKKIIDKKETDIMHLRRLNHKNIVRFKGFCTIPPQYCIIMEFCPHGPLYMKLHDPDFKGSPEQLLNWATDIAEGMQYLHSQSIIHRDLKTPNILLCANYEAKVSDFGSSRKWNEISQVMTFGGTIPWMAPEIIQSGLCSNKIDVWSYGVVLWEILLREIPYKEMEAQAIIFSVGSETFRLHVPSSVPFGLQMILEQCLNYNPRRRPSFTSILKHLQIASTELLSMSVEEFLESQSKWREDVSNHSGYVDCHQKNRLCTEETELIKKRLEELKQATKNNALIELQLKDIQKTYIEIMAVKLEIEQREKQVEDRERCVAIREDKYNILRKYYHKHHRKTSCQDHITESTCASNTFDAPKKLRHHKKRNDSGVKQENISKVTDDSIVDKKTSPVI